MTTFSDSTDRETRVRVELGTRSYDVRVVSDDTAAFAAFARSALDATWGGRSCRRALIVVDQAVERMEPAYSAAFAGLGIAATRAVVPPGEASKSLDRACDLYDELVKVRADRHTAIVALGGGVVGDLAGFVAATYARGLPLLMIPTTLLAQVDSSVGGKVAVNHPRVKNIIGAFHQPVGVWIDTESLRTLPDREYYCGLGEVIKYGVIMDAAFFEFLERSAGAILGREPACLRHVVAHSCRLKAEVVALDEREETGCRAKLNFGHTVAHAIESVSGYGSRFHHGEAVAAGMVAECRLAERLGWIDAATTARVRALVERFHLPVSPAGLDAGAMIEVMTRDKKNLKGKTRYVLPRRIGHVELTDAPLEADVRDVLTT